MSFLRNLLLGATLLIASLPVTAATITLDFDTAATGSGIIGAPLVTPLGTISAANAELVIFTSDPEFNAAGASGNKIDHLGAPGIARLDFDFDVSSVTLIYGGNTGDITIRVRDASNAVVDSFFQASTDFGQPAGPLTLSGAGIRSLEWFENGGSFAGLDNIEITANVPVPSSLVLLGLGLMALGFSRRVIKLA